MRTLSVGTKLAYGIGQAAEGIKTRGFDYVAFFFFTQVLGLSGSLAGLAVAIALIFDAVTDPVAGHLSDNWKSRLGRRHPFMYAAAAPLGLSWCLMFFAPHGLGQLGLFLWFLVSAVLVRASMTLYHVPHLALGAELTDDYAERTSVVQYRIFFAMSGALGVVASGIYVFLPSSPEFENGMLNPAGYPAFAIFSGLIMTFTVWYSAWGTRKEIPHLPGPPENPQPFSLRTTFGEFALAWQNISFRALFIGFSLFAISISIGNTIGTHLYVFFFGFDTAQIPAVIGSVGLGFVLGVGISGVLHVRVDKKPSLIASCLIAIAMGALAVVLRLLGWLPANGEAVLFWFIVSVQFLVGIAAGVAYTSAGSMMADVAQDQFHETGKNQQGILFSAISFSGKLGSAGGHLFAGVGLDLIRFPLQSGPSEVPESMVIRLGLLSLVSLPIAATGIYAYTLYRINRVSYAAAMAAQVEGRVLSSGP